MLTLGPLTLIVLRHVKLSVKCTYQLHCTASLVSIGNLLYQRQTLRVLGFFNNLEKKHNPSSVREVKNFFKIEKET